jgi:hypothetical protein
VFMDVETYTQLLRFESGKELWPIRIGCINLKDQIPKFSMMAMQYTSGDDSYFVCMEIFHKGVKRTKQVSILGNL